MAAALAAATETADTWSGAEPTVATPIVTARADETSVMHSLVPEPPRATVPARIETPTSPHGGGMSSRAKWLIAAVVAAIIVAVVIVSQSSNPGTPPVAKTPSSAGTPTSSTPAPLSQAIDDLNRAVTP
jgi:hypothetical protein